MKKYRLSFEYVYTHLYEDEFEAIDRIDAIRITKEKIGKFSSSITSGIELIELGEVISVNFNE